MSVLTPFGQLSYGSEKGVPRWVSAHDTQHRAYNQALALVGLGLGNYPMQTKVVSKDWLARNLFNHMSLTDRRRRSLRSVLGNLPGTLALPGGIDPHRSLT